MCGIAGIVAPALNDAEKLKQTVQLMSDTLYHRGPDSDGCMVAVGPHLAIGHRRLSIIDLSSSGHQPMSSANNRLHIVFNGEIYNYQILANGLKLLGYKFRGQSDTEVLLTAIEEWGIEDALDKARGMFAMAIWDSQKNQLILCRDRMGEKPLFYGWIDNNFIFASELKAIRKVFPGSLRVNEGAFSAFLRFGYVPTPYSIYNDIYKLLPGTFLCIPLDPLPSINQFSPFGDSSDISPKTYWSLAEVSRQGVASPIHDEKEAVAYLDELLQDTINCQKIADVPIGSFLSGGIDSSLVTSVMQAVSSKPIKTFTIGFNEKEFDEAPYARAIAQHIGSEHHEYYLSANDGLNFIPELPKYWDEPFADSSQIPSLLVAQKAKNHVTVCLTGDGGDELFCGYNRYFLMQSIWQKKLYFPDAMCNIASNLIGKISLPNWQRLYNLYNSLTFCKSTQANFGLKIHKLSKIIRMESQSQAYKYLLSYWQEPDDILKYSSEVESILDFEPEPKMDDFIHNAMYWDQQGYLVDDNLVKGDRSSMAHSLETRLPLLDHRIVEYSWRIPSNMKYRNGESKWLLRQVLERYLPKNLIERPKMGFSVPVGKWLRGPLKDWAYDLLMSKRLPELISLDRRQINHIWEEHQAGTRDHSHKLWVLCMWFAWLDS